MSWKIVMLRLGWMAWVMVGSANLAWAAEGHEHAGHAAPVGLTLNHGKPWPTDAPLRQGMAAIRDALTDALPGIHAGSYTGGQYASLADKAQEQVDFMVKNCQLPPEVDAQAHQVLERILGGIGSLRGKEDPAAGAVTLLQALNDYARHFDHPGWKPIPH
ncbi:MAG: hypothetical protein HQL51_01205 [Magnetococcales bacterium]|nr:hypothetical protein [Magnetococcales bacterium]